MMRLLGHFDGRHVVLDQPVPSELRPNTAVEVLVPDGRDRALRDLKEFLTALWARPLPLSGQPQGRTWAREELRRHNIRVKP